jgi:hypothetical protein
MESLAAREQLGLGQHVACDARPLPHGIGRQGDDVDGVVEPAVRKRAGNVVAHLGDERGLPVCVHHLAECHDAHVAEVGEEQLLDARTVRLGRLAHQDRRELELTPAAAHHLEARVLPVDESAAPCAPKDQRPGSKPLR